MQNKTLLDGVKRGQWLHVRKTKGIWAKKLEEDTRIETLEGWETARAGNLLCRGIKGELWPQKEEEVLKKYTPTSVYNGEFRKYQPIPDGEGLLAARIKSSFTVITEWGTQKGKSGDYLVKNFRDKNTKYPTDVWVVDGKIFWASYSTIVDPQVANLFMSLVRT